MTHGDDNGLVLPPAVAPIQVVILPIQQQKEGVLEAANELYTALKNAGLRVKLDDSNNSPGWKFAEYEMKGVPLRIELGPRDIADGVCVAVKRTGGGKTTVPLSEIVSEAARMLVEVRDELFAAALKNREERTYTCKNTDEITQALKAGDGFIKAMWCGAEECEDQVKALTGVGSRCIPEAQENLGDTCVCCGKSAKTMLYWGKAY
jgi:prolyl-tRNA synthetase